MGKLFFALVLAFSSLLHSIEKLDDRYLISFGDKNASIQVVEYFSFMCPHCSALFKREFKDLKSNYLENNKIAFTFHPVPMDMLTVCAMECLSKLNEREKRAFLEVLLQESEGEDSKVMIALMKRAMEVFEKPIPQLDDRSYLEESETFQNAFVFLKQDEQIIGIPTFEVNGKFYAEQPPSLVLLEKIMKEISCGLN